MIRCFRRSKIASCSILFLTLLIDILIWIRNTGRPLYIPIIASLLMLGVGICSSKLLGNFLAEQENNRLLSILHMDLNPETFVSLYQTVPSHTAPDSFSRAVTSAYLADGYCACGNWDQALKSLSSNIPKNRKGETVASLQYLYHNNRCNYLYLMGNIELADHELKELKQALQNADLQNPALISNMTDSVKLYENWSHYYHDDTVDTNALTKMAAETHFQIRRLEIHYLVALTYLRDSRIRDAKKELKLLIENSGQLYLKTLAEDLLRAI